MSFLLFTTAGVTKSFGHGLWKCDFAGQSAGQSRAPGSRTGRTAARNSFTLRRERSGRRLRASGRLQAIFARGPIRWTEAPASHGTMRNHKPVGRRAPISSPATRKQKPGPAPG